MADSILSRGQLLAGAPDNTLRLISPQKYRDFITSAFGAAFAFDPTPQDDKDGTAGHGTYDTGSVWLNIGPTKSVWRCFAGNHNAADWRQIWPPAAPPAATVVADGTGIDVTFDGIDTYTVSLETPVDLANLPTYPKSKVSSTGTWSTAEIPTLPKSKIDSSGQWALAEIPSGYLFSNLAGVPSFPNPEGPWAFAWSGTTPSKRWYPAGLLRPFPSSAPNRVGFTTGQIYAIPMVFARGVTITEIGIEINGTTGERKSMAIYASNAASVGNLYPNLLVQDLGQQTIGAGGIGLLKFTAGLPLTLSPGVLYWVCYRQAEPSGFGTMSLPAQYYAAVLGIEEVGGVVLGAGIACVAWGVTGAYATTWPGTFPAGGFGISGDTNVLPALIFRS